MEDLRPSNIADGAEEPTRVVHFDEAWSQTTDATPAANITISTNGADTTYVNLEGTDSTTNLDTEMMETVERLIEDGEVKVDTEKGEEIVRAEDEKSAPKVPETPKQIRARQRKENPKEYEYRRRLVIMQKTATNVANIEKKRKRHLHKEVIGSNVIALDKNGNMMHTTRMMQMEMFKCRFESSLLFDKNHNLMSPDPDNRLRRKDRKVTPRTGMRITKKHIFHSTHTHNPTVRKFIVIDKGALLDSEGTDFKIIKRNEMKISELLTVKKRMRIGYHEMIRAIEHLKASIGNVLPPEDFEIIYEFGSLSGVNRISLFLRFRDVVIRNSIEMSRNIGDIIVKQEIEHHINPGYRFPLLIFGSGLSGMRMTFSTADVIAGYQHSHISGGVSTAFSSFCTGGESYSMESPDPMAIEAHIHRLREFVSWESLEGGPYNRIENIDNNGSVHNLHTDPRTVRLPYQAYTTPVMDRINERGGFDLFKNCFKLVTHPEKMYFKIDYRRFFSQMIELFDNEFLEGIKVHNRNRRYHYKPETNRFYRLRDTVHTKQHLTKHAIQRVAKAAPVYMNGRYVKPTVVEHSDPLNGIRFCPDPDLMNQIANVILYHLTDKLEEYGNTRNQ